MIIDFHTHIFPDSLAPRALASLLEKCSGMYNPCTDMTLSGLLKVMDEWNIDISVVQPVITKASQLIKTNEWAGSICSDRIISFGGIYPHTEDYKSDIDYVAGLGLKGLKFHPEYQDFVVDAPDMLKIYDYALSRGLILLFHAGFDPAVPGPYKSTPQQFAHIVDELKGGTIVAAHFGGSRQWEDVERYLAGRDIYLDTSMGFEYYSHDRFIRIVKQHGADKVLFASDSPWSHTKTEIEHLKRQPLSEQEKAAILGDNAARILQL